MTTIVTVKAHCGDDKKVLVEIRDKDDCGVPYTNTILDGGEASFNAYGERSITIREVPK